MSALAGLVRRDGMDADLAGVRRMMVALRHRPHDDEAVRQVGAAGFGHQKLVTTPESAQEDLPLAADACLLTADLRLDNRAELLRALGARGDVPDGALVVRAYQRWGASCVEHLLGDFAFAIWDDSKQSLLCARDHLGMKSLFYHLGDRVFAFGSEIRALLALEEVPRALNLPMARDHLLGLPGEAGETLYRGISRLPPGSTLTLGREGAPVLREYWRLDPARELPTATDDQLVEEFRTLFTEAVSCRLRSATPPGATLSGGFDSSAVVCVARRLLDGTPFHAFSIRFPEVPECDEGPFIECIREAGGFAGHDVPGDAGSPLGDLLPHLAHFDEPCLIQNLHLSCAAYRAAAGQGVRVMLDGHDGDTTISKAPGRAARPATRRSLVRSVAGLLLHPCRVWSRVWAGLRPAPPRSTDRAGLLSEELARLTGAEERLARFRRETEDATAAGERAHHLRRLANGYSRYASEAMERLGAGLGIEPRHPFYDRRLLELCLALPPSMKNRDGFSRYVARRALGGVLPDPVRWRPGKTSLGPQFHRGFRTTDGPAVLRAFQDNRAVLAPFVDLARAQETCERYRQSPDAEAGSQLWAAVTFALWLRQCGLSP